MTTRPLHLAIDTGPLYGHRTGVGNAVDGMVRALDRRHDVELAPYLVSYRSKTSEGHRRLPVPGIVASHLWSRSNLPKADLWMRDVDVVHGTNYVAPPTRRPVVVSVYDCWFLTHPDIADPLVRRAGKILRRRVAKGAWIHASSHATAERVAELLHTERVATVHLGPPSVRGLGVSDLAGRVDTMARTPAAGVPFVLAIGTEERRKDLPTLVAAFGHVAGALPDVALVLAGAAGNHSDDVTAAIDALPNPARSAVFRLGPVDDTTKRWLLRHAAVLAYPSLDEGFGFPILEAQSAGTPVVASDAGAIPEIAGEGAILVPRGSVDSFASALIEVLDGSTSRLGLIATGHANVSRFSWEATAAGLVDLYQRARQDT